MKEARTIRELIEVLEQFEDKDQTIHVWGRHGYYGTGLTVEVAEDQTEKPLIIEC